MKRNRESGMAITLIDLTARPDCYKVDRTNEGAGGDGESIIPAEEKSLTTKRKRTKKSK